MCHRNVQPVSHLFLIEGPWQVLYRCAPPYRAPSVERVPGETHRCPRCQDKDAAVCAQVTASPGSRKVAARREKGGREEGQTERRKEWRREEIRTNKEE